MSKLATIIFAAVTIMGCGDLKQPLVLDSDLWLLQTSDSTQATLNASNPCLEFLVDGQLRGQTGCNIFYGHYTCGYENIDISIEGHTMNICPDEEQEHEFLRRLTQAKGYSIKGENLTLFDSTQQAIVTFTSASKIQKKQ